MKTPRPAPGGAWRAAMAVGLVAAGVFVALATLRLEAQGPYYDELHQATGAFTWLGSPPRMFCEASWGRACLLNMSYSGAIKTNLYGAYLRLGPQHFSLLSWRLFAIVPVAVAIVGFCLIASPALPPWGLVVFLVLLLTDINLLLNTRHDTGPVALALVARLMLVAVWLRGDATDEPATPGNSFALGAITGLAIFEKLSSTVSIAGLAVAVSLGSGRRRTARHLRAMAAGLLAGLAPLAAINLYTQATQHRLISLADVVMPGERSAGWLRHLWHYLSLGQGPRAQEWMLGLGTSSWATVAEAASVVLIGLVIGVAALRAGASPRLRLAGLLMATYGAIALGLYLLPRRVAAHHLIIGTPYQYAAVALALVALGRTPRRRPSGRALRMGLTVLVAAWIGLRLVTIWPVEVHLAHGDAGEAWDPSLRGLALFAAARRDVAVFVASDWGVATQIYCFADGRPDLVYEPFWRYAGVHQLHDFQRRSGKSILYLVRLRRPAMVRAEATRRIEDDLATDPAWREVDPEPEARDLRVVAVRKYVYRPVTTPGS
jgi:hypothetical protein